MRIYLVSIIVCLISLSLFVYVDSSPYNIFKAFSSILKRAMASTHPSSSTNGVTNRTGFPGLPVVPPNDPSLTANTTIPRAVRMHFLAREQAEGEGARVRRSIGTPKLRNFSPFLMLDHFSVEPGAGFPDHPHRGQETITYLLEGAVDHEDFAGNRGTIWPGDLQFMTAGYYTHVGGARIQTDCTNLVRALSTPRSRAMARTRNPSLACSFGLT